MTHKSDFFDHVNAHMEYSREGIHSYDVEGLWTHKLTKSYLPQLCKRLGNGKTLIIAICIDLDLVHIRRSYANDKSKYETIACVSEGDYNAKEVAKRVAMSIFDEKLREEWRLL